MRVKGNKKVKSLGITGFGGSAVGTQAEDREFESLSPLHRNVATAMRMLILK